MMRLALTLPLLALTLAPCFAQSNDFNPYQATLDGMSLAAAEPLIEAAYGPIGERYAGIAEPYDGGPVQVLGVGAGERYAMFLFCEDKLSAFGSPISPAVAGDILNPLNQAAATKFHASGDGITVFAENDELIVAYRGIGTKQSWISATYPATPMHMFDFSDYCATKTD